MNLFTEDVNVLKQNESCLKESLSVFEQNTSILNTYVS